MVRETSENSRPAAAKIGKLRESSGNIGKLQETLVKSLAMAGTIY